jgi:hypothetical protein
VADQKDLNVISGDTLYFVLGGCILVSAVDDGCYHSSVRGDGVAFVEHGIDLSGGALHDCEKNF